MDLYPGHLQATEGGRDLDWASVVPTGREEAVGAEQGTTAHNVRLTIWVTPAQMPQDIPVFLHRWPWRGGWSAAGREEPH